MKGEPLTIPAYAFLPEGRYSNYELSILYTPTPYYMTATKKLSFRVLVFVISSLLLFPVPSVFASAFITLDHFSGTPGDVRVSGGGFMFGEPISLYLNAVTGAPAASTDAGSDGFFGPTTVSIPVNSPQGSVRIIAVGNTTTQRPFNTFYITAFNPNITVTGDSLPGSSLDIDGNGFAPNEQVRFTLNGGAVGQATADSNGNFSNAVGTLPFVAPGTYQFHATGQASTADAITYLYIGEFFPSVTPSLYYILPAQVLNFSGNGFAPNETIRILDGNTQNELATVTADNTGTITNLGNISIPFEWMNSNRTFQLVGDMSNGTAEVSITVGQFNSLAFPSAYYVNPGEQVRFSGNGFGPGETVRITEGANPTLLATVTADASGNFLNAGAFTIPFSWNNSTRTFHVTGQQSLTRTDIPINISSFSPSLIPSTYYIVPGERVLISGNGFAPDEPVTVSMLNGPTIGTATTSTGAFIDVGPFTAPLRGTTLQFTATGQNSGATSNVEITLGSLYPTITPDSWYIMSGRPVSFSGSGFAPNENVQLTNGAAILATFPTDGTGSFSNQTVTTGFGMNRDITYTFTGLGTGSAVDATITVAGLQPYIALDNYYALPGTTVAVTGAGFSPNESVTVTLGSATAGATASSEGVFGPTSINIPVNTPGPTVDIVATGNTSNASAISLLTLAPFMVQVSPSTWYTPPGTSVSFSGSGFNPNEEVIIIQSGANITTVTANGTGDFISNPITIPVTATSSANFVFTGSESNASASVDITLAGFSPQVDPSAWYTLPGSNVIFTGINFAPGETVDISVNGTILAAATTDAAGGFTSPPVRAPFSTDFGTFTLTGTISNVPIEIPIAIAPLQPGIQLSTYYNQAGTPITITSMGYGGNENVNVLFGEQLIGTPTTGDDGNLTFTTTVPYQPAGDKIVQVTGQDSNVSASAPFTIAPVYIDLQLGSYAGAPGTAVNFIGNGYLANEPVTITTDRTGTTTVHTITADASGRFNNSGFTIPNDFTSGPLTFTVRGEYSFSTMTITYYVTGG